MKTFSSTIKQEYKNGKGRAVVEAELDGNKFRREYDPCDESAEKKVSEELASFMHGRVVKDDDGRKHIEAVAQEKNASEAEATVDVHPENEKNQEPPKAEDGQKRVDDQIEALLNRAGNTMKDIAPWLEEIYDGTHDGDISNLAGFAMTHIDQALHYLNKEYPADPITMTAALSLYGMRQTAIIDRLCWALDNTLNRYEKLKYRLNSWGDIHYVQDVEDGKI